LAFGSNELFKEIISLFEKKQEGIKPAIMPMSHIFLSGMLTGMVSTLAIVNPLIT
jgi:hypothetical protein